MVTQRSNLGKDCPSLQQLLPNGSASMRYLMHTPRVGSPLNIGTLPYFSNLRNASAFSNLLLGQSLDSFDSRILSASDIPKQLGPMSAFAFVFYTRWPVLLHSEISMFDVKKDNFFFPAVSTQQKRRLYNFFEAKKDFWHPYTHRVRVDQLPETVLKNYCLTGAAMRFAQRRGARREDRTKAESTASTGMAGQRYENSLK
ncbi:hypothetical protein WR25_26809 [Diploscapter pachys]|uniref:Uncharacterized protein n=1 Tax=Diploscapter pachys TaxID=2018661 RepID=A0A2A2KKP6_9BILA|nr:hypothetical protein WR25_26809 [Diploscapter pachys]